MHPLRRVRCVVVASIVPARSTKDMQAGMKIRCLVSIRKGGAAGNKREREKESTERGWYPLEVLVLLIVERLCIDAGLARSGCCWSWKCCIQQ